MFDFNMRPRLK